VVLIITLIYIANHVPHLALHVLLAEQHVLLVFLIIIYFTVLLLVALRVRMGNIIPLAFKNVNYVVFIAKPVLQQPQLV